MCWRLLEAGERHVLCEVTAHLGAQDTVLLSGKAHAVTLVARGYEKRKMANFMKPESTPSLHMRGHPFKGC